MTTPNEKQKVTDNTFKARLSNERLKGAIFTYMEHEWMKTMETLDDIHWEDLEDFNRYELEWAISMEREYLQKAAERVKPRLLKETVVEGELPPICEIFKNFWDEATPRSELVEVSNTFNYHMKLLRNKHALNNIMLRRGLEGEKKPWETTRGFKSD